MRNFILFQNSKAHNYWKDAWVFPYGQVPATIAKCDNNGNPDGTYYGNCWSGDFTDACQMGYDYYSIMHYSLGLG